jgi:hypothetical protein
VGTKASGESKPVLGEATEASRIADGGPIVQRSRAGSESDELEAICSTADAVN